MLTMDVYSHVLPSMQEAATEKLEGILFKQTGTQQAAVTEGGTL
jgi:hypothetical protein